MKKIFSSNVEILIFSIVISIPVILPFLSSGYFPTHDGEWAVVRLTDMFRTLRDFQFPVRFSGNLNFGYGYPLFNFAYPFPYYLGVLLHFLGLGFISSVKFLFVISIPLSAFFMVLASKEVWQNKWAGFISALLYIYLPYRMVDLYARGSLGESLSFVLFPLIFFIVIKIFRTPNIFFIILGAIFYAILITTHNIMTVLFSIVLLPVFIFTIIKKKKNIISLGFMTLLSLLLSGFFWIPALFEKQFIALSQTPIADRNLYFVKLDQLIIPKWGYGVPTDLGGFSYQIGIPHVLLFLLVISFITYFFLVKEKKAKNELLTIATILVVTSLGAIFLMFKESQFLWKLPLLSEINYPWTLLAPLGFLISLLAGFLSTQRKDFLYIAILISICSVILVLPHARPQEYFQRDDNYYLTNDATTTSSNEFMPLWVKKNPIARSADKVEIIQGQGEVNNVLYNSKKIEFSGDFTLDSFVRINTIYYPGWKIYIDNKLVPVSYNNEKGVMDINVSPGRHTVKALFTETPLRSISNVLSVAGCVIAIFLFLMRKKINYAIN